MEMAHFFDKLGNPGKGMVGNVTQFMSDHPNPANRERAIEQEARLLPQQKYGYESGEFKRMKGVVAKIHEPTPKPPQQQAPQSQQQ